MVKTQDTEEACAHNKAFFKELFGVKLPRTVFKPDTILAGHFDKARLYSSIVMFGATYTEQGQAVSNFEGDWIIRKPFAGNDETTPANRAGLGKSVLRRCVRQYYRG